MYSELVQALNAAHTPLDALPILEVSFFCLFKARLSVTVRRCNAVTTGCDAFCLRPERSVKGVQCL